MCFPNGALQQSPISLFFWLTAIGAGRMIGYW
jgi:hypothetical protein